jgi:hypothetical protein
MTPRLTTLMFLSLAAFGCADYTAPKPQTQTGDRGAFTLSVSGALNGSTHLEARPLLDNLGNHADFVGMASPEQAGLFVIRVQRAASEISQRGGQDAGVVAINPLVTAPGVFHNGSCRTDAGDPAACMGVTYAIGGDLPGTPGAGLSVLTTLMDDRDTVVVDEITNARVRVSVAGPFLWSRQATATSAVLVDTVFVRASFDAFLAHP